MSDNHERRERDYDREKRRASRDLEFITQEEAREIAAKTIKEELEKLFKQLGLDISTYIDIRKLNDDLTYLRQSRETNSERKSNLFKSLVTSLVGAVVGVMTSAFIWFLTHVKP